MDCVIEISVTDIEPMSDFIQDMSDIVGYLRYKANPSVMELKVIESYDSFYNQIDKDIDGKPNLQLLRGD
ncbi:hypothetical protein [Carnobacterium pleistocenium]|uniref:hypothetical protein n=1 Tax=Carnobacterium pleistocenium TaxID=181073 RepID=UPI000555F3F0|nr:hypothetical protein [Carnobacterium pleistocenium]